MTLLSTSVLTSPFFLIRHVAGFMITFRCSLCYQVFRSFFRNMSLTLIHDSFLFVIFKACTAGSNDSLAGQVV